MVQLLNIHKVGQDFPIHKMVQKNQYFKHCPISIYSPSKLFERYIYEQIYNNFTKNKIFYSNQFGFKRNMFTEHAVKHLCDDLTILMKKIFILCFLCLIKAFYSVNHKILLYKLQKYSIWEIPFQFLKSYLSNQIQYSVLNGVKSKLFNINCGIPQGFTLEFTVRYS